MSRGTNGTIAPKTAIAAFVHQRRAAGDGLITILEDAKSINETQFSPPLTEDAVLAAVVAAIRTESDTAAVERALQAAADAPPPLTDQGNAERLAIAHGHELRYVPGLGWHAWDGRRFKRDTDGAVVGEWS